MCRVVNLRGASYDVYIGRAGRGQDGYFGNPFPVSLGREECIRKFEEYARARLLTDSVWKDRIKALKDKTLGCFCKPLACHGDVLAKLCDELNKGA